MNWLLRLLLCLLAFPCLAQTNTASVTAYCRSLALNAATAYSGNYTLAFTTSDHTTNLPQFIPGNPPVFSSEVRPVAGQSGTYESDYEWLSGSTAVQYGSLTLALSGADTNHDSIPDLLNPAQTMYCTVPGTGYSSWPSSNNFALNLRFERAAGSSTGTFSGNWAIAGANYSVAGSLHLLLLQGSATYTRGRTNQLQLQLTRLLPDGTTTTLTGAVAYAASPNQISLPRFYLTDARGRSYTAMHCVLSRHGHRYVGNLNFVDGAPETPWPDYLNWILTLTDPNDTDGNGIPDISDPNAVHIPTAPLCLTINGQGSVWPALGGKNLELGTTYRLTATPDTGYLFAGWSGDRTSLTRTLSFTMQTNLSLQANFVPNPFYPVRGAYYGLIEDTNVLVQTFTNAYGEFSNTLPRQTLGSFTATTTANGAYSLKLRLGDQAFTVSGAFDDSGSTYPVIVPSNLRPLFIQLHLDLTNGTGLSGFISNSTWSASITAHKPPYDPASNPCAFAGKYTFVLPAMGAYGGPPSGPPLGHSYGTASMDAVGRVRCSARLADGTRATQATGLSGTGDWPLYLSLYANKGSLAGWLTLTNPSVYPPSGQPWWHKPAATTRCAPAGFTNWVSLLLAAAAGPGSDRSLLTWTNGFISFYGGTLQAPVVGEVTVGPRNKLALSATNKLSLHLLANGLFEGRVTLPGASRPVAFQGALLQPTGIGEGYWLDHGESGAVTLGPPLGLPGQPGSTNPPARPPGILPPRPLPTNYTNPPRLLTNVLILRATNTGPILITNFPPIAITSSVPILVTNLPPIAITSTVPILVTNLPPIAITNPPWPTLDSSGAVLQEASSAGASTVRYPSSGALPLRPPSP